MLNSKGFLLACIVVAVITAAADFLTADTAVPGINLLAVLCGCGVLIAFGVFVLRPLLQRAEDYYGGGEEDE